MSQRFLSCTLLIFLLVAPLGTSKTQADILHDEDTMGDLSNSQASPTDKGPIGADTWTIDGAVETFNFPQDEDVITFEVMPGFELTSANVFFGGSGNHFFGFAAEDFAPSSGSAYLVSVLVNGDAGAPMDLFSLPDPKTAHPSIVVDYGGPGVTGPLPAGDYTFFFNETASGSFSPYSVTFGVTAVAVPEPTTALALLPLGYVAYRRRKKAAAVVS